jgi:predicted nuclease of predicted toxin-antitoxin system
MKIIIDECLPKRMTQFFKTHNVWTVPQIGLNGYKDTELLKELDKRNIDIFITIDGNIEYQQQFNNRNFGTIVIRAVSNRFLDLKQFENELQEVVQSIQSGIIIHVPS